MKYWLTTHWPSRKDNLQNDTSGVWLPDEREAAGAELAPGDLVLVYESKSGRTEVRQLPDGSTKRIPCHTGREGVVYYGRITSGLSAIPDSQKKYYIDGSSIWWRWFAPIEVLSRSGFVPRREVAAVLGYKPTYNFRGFGTLHSGLREISATEFKDIISRYHAWQPLKLPKFRVPRAGSTFGGGGGESDAHLYLKKFVASNPALVIGEQGLKTVRVEYPFPTGDRADIVLTDAHSRVVAVEVETSVGKSDIIGPMQAIKYRFMLEWITRRAHGDSRAILVAYSIHGDIRNMCKAYGVECVEVDQGHVEQWRIEQNL